MMISEEFPDAIRGRAIAALSHGCICRGDRGGAYLRDHGGVAWGWRGMYLLGIAPLVLVAFLRRSARDRALQGARTGARCTGLPRHEFWTSIRNSWRRLRDRIARACWSGRAMELDRIDRRPDGYLLQPLRAARSSLEIAPSRGGGNCRLRDGDGRQLLSGFLMDRLGRKFTTSFFYLMSAVSMDVLFEHRQLRRDPCGRSCHDVCVSSGAHRDLGAVDGIVSDLDSSNRIWSVRTGDWADCWMLSPVVIGLLSGRLGGLGNAASLFAAGPILGVVIVLWFVPETRGKTLEELSPSIEATPPAAAE